MSCASTEPRPRPVNCALTANRRSRVRVENDDYGASVRRMAACDVECLRDLAA